MTTPSAQGAAAAAPAPQPAPATAAAPAQAAPAPHQAPAAWTPAGDPAAAPQATSALGRTPSTMPRDLRRLRAAAPIACALTGIAASGFLGTTGLQASPAATTRQLAHVTEAKQAFQRADVAAAEIAANRALGATAAKRSTYDDAIASVHASLVAAADAAPGAESLADAAGALTSYTAAVERVIAAPAKSTAQANDYRTAAATARDQVLGKIDQVAAADLDRLSGGGGAASRPGGTLLVLLIGGGSTLGLGLASWWLARKTHRIVNPGLAAATLITAGLTFLTLVPSARPGNDASGAVDAAKSVAALRDSAYAARIAEVDRLLPGGSDAGASEQTWQARTREVNAALRRHGQLSNSWNDYANLHPRLAAASPGERPNVLAASGDAFGTFMAEVDRTVEQRQQGVDQSVTQPATITAGVALGAGLLAGGLAWAGIGRRLDEYR